MTIGFLGFGEAGSTLAQGLARAGVDDLVAYDIAWQDVPLVRERADRTGVRLVADPEQLAGSAQVIISAVICAQAHAAIRSIMAGLTSQHWVLDINSVGRDTKVACDHDVRSAGGRYVDVALMANVSADLANLPLLVAGPDDPSDLAPLMDSGVVFRHVSDVVGDAAHIKLCRSLIIKGLEALALEALSASYAGGVHHTVLDSIDESFGAYSLGDMIRHLIGRHAVHGVRRADELREAASTLEDVGVEPLLARAGYERMRRGIEAGLQQRFDPQRDPGWEDVLQQLDHLRADTGPPSEAGAHTEPGEERA